MILFLFHSYIVSELTCRLNWLSGTIFEGDPDEILFTPLPETVVAMPSAPLSNRTVLRSADVARGHPKGLGRPLGTERMSVDSSGVMKAV
jgi:hypothetical protein